MLEKIKEFYRTKRTSKVVVTVLVMVLLIGGVTYTALFQPTSASKLNNNVADKFKSTKEKLDKATQDINKEAEVEKTANDDKKKTDEDTVKADDTSKEATSTLESANEAPSASPAKSGSNTDNTSGQHVHNWMAKEVFHERVKGASHVVVIPGKTEDYEYFLFEDGCKYPASNNLAPEMHEDNHGKMNHTMITETVTVGKETGYVVQDSPDIPEWTETIYTCSCGATK